MTHQFDEFAFRPTLLEFLMHTKDRGRFETTEKVKQKVENR